MAEVNYDKRWAQKTRLGHFFTALGKAWTEAVEHLGSQGLRDLDRDNGMCPFIRRKGTFRCSRLKANRGKPCPAYGILSTYTELEVSGIQKGGPQYPRNTVTAWVQPCTALTWVDPSLLQ